MKTKKRNDNRLPSHLIGLIVCLCLLLASLACNKQSGTSDEKTSNANNAPAASGAIASREAEQIVERYRAFDKSRNSMIKTRARIQETDGSTREVVMVMYRKLETDGRKLMLVEFAAPAEERDRAALVVITPQGEIEGTRYIQSSNSFVTTKDVMGEDALFGMTLQELADGQIEKYDVAVKGEETIGPSPVYRVEGKLKQGAESKFPRLSLLISKDNYAALVAEFYDAQNNLARRITVDKMEQVEGHWTRMHWIVDNRARQKKIDFETTSAKYDQKIEPSVFTPEYLKKIASR